MTNSGIKIKTSTLALVNMAGLNDYFDEIVAERFNRLRVPNDRVMEAMHEAVLQLGSSTTAK